jgi:Mrp family chromosome partitioning ATPase
VLFTRAAILGDQAHAGRNGNGNGNGGAPGGTLFEPAHDEPLVVMITSASPGEGKTTTTANLAAVFAEAGSSVLVVNCDFRRPNVHRFFGVDDEPRRVQETNVAGVKIVTNVLSDPGSNPSQVVAAQRQVVAAARGRFDVILLDTAPLLTANDAVELVPSADMLLLVSRMGVTRADAAERSIELLNRLDVAIAGVVLVGAASASNDYYYYYQPGRVGSGAAVPKAHAEHQATANGNGNGNGATNGTTNGTGHPVSAPDVFAPKESD